MNTDKNAAPEIPEGWNAFNKRFPEMLTKHPDGTITFKCEICEAQVLIQNLNVFMYDDEPKTTKGLCWTCCHNEYMKINGGLN